MFYLVRIFRTSSLGDSISRNPERTLWGGEERSQVIYKVCNKGQVVWTSKSWLIEENQITQAKEFGVLCMGSYIELESFWLKSLGSLKSFLWYAPQPSGVCIMCFLIPGLLRAGCSSWLLDGGYPVSILSCRSCNVVASWLQHPLLTTMAGKIFPSQ